MRTVILNQRKECERLLSLPYQERMTELPREQLLATKTIKLITGPRRVGKSVFALLLLRNKNFAYLNFDDKRLLSVWDEDLAMRTLQDVYPGYEFLLLDEVQNLPDWHFWVSKLLRNGLNMVITGSNSQMLSQEMSTILTGRYLPINMLPFSLEEVLRWHQLDIHALPDEQRAEWLSLRDEYLRLGGYPETLQARAMTRNYLNTLYEAIIMRDVAVRHKIRNMQALYDVADYLLANFCNLVTANEVASELGMRSVATTQKFMNFLHEPFLFYYLPRYNNKLKLMQKAARKVYVVDNGFVEASAFSVTDNLGRLLENMVFVELLRRGYDIKQSLFYYRSRTDKEVDFVTRKGHHIEQMIQVCYDLSSEKTRKRELDALVECAEELHCDNLYIVTYNESRTIAHGNHAVHIVSLYDWLSADSSKP